MKKFLLLLILHSALIIQHSYSQSPAWLWAKGVGGTNVDYALALVTDVTGNVYSTGYFKGTVDFDPGIGTSYLTATGTTDAFILKQDSSGNFIWAKRIGGTSLTEIYSITLDDTSNVYIAGRFQGTVDFDPGAATFNITFSGGSYDMFVSKLNNSGDFVWAKAMHGSATQPYTIALDGAGNIYTSGTFAGTADFDPDAGTVNLSAIAWDIFISKINNTGNFIWAKRIGGSNYDWAYSIAIANTPGEEVYFTGGFQGTVDFDPDTGTFNLVGSSGSSDIFISKLDSAGNFIWAKGIGGAGSDAGKAIAIDNSGSGDAYATGSFILTADFDPNAGTFNLTSSGVDEIFVVRLDTSGNLVWAKAMGGSAFDFGTSIALDPAGSGSVYTTGYFDGTADFDPGTGTHNLISAGSYDIFISKLDNAGNFVWATSAEGSSTDRGEAIALDASSNVFVTGTFGSDSISFGANLLVNADPSGGSTDMFIAKLDHVITGIENVNAPDGISVFPNPFSNEIVASIAYHALSTKTGEIILFDIMGKEILRQHISAKTTKIKTEKLATGFYLLRYSEGNHEVNLKLLKF